MVNREIKNEIGRLCDEMDAILSMDEEKVCGMYNVDGKGEVIRLLSELIRDLRSDYSELVETEEREERLERESVLFAFRDPARQLLMDC